MIRRSLWVGVIALAMLGLATDVFAQSRGRTDGPEGSEYGKGGYNRLGGAQQFSLALDWGAAIESDNTYTGSPLFLPNNNVRFGISPQAGFDFMLERHVILGIGYAPDIPLGDGGGVAHRIFMTIGYRF